MKNAATAPRRFLISVALIGATVTVPAVTAWSEEAPPAGPLSVPPTSSQYRPPASSVSPEDALLGQVSSDELVQFAVAAPTIVKPQSPGAVAKNSPKAKQLPGVRRPCEKARGFTVYATKDVAGLPLKQVHSTCETPSGVEGGRLLRSGRINETVAEYGRCVLRARKAPPCPRQLTVTSTPSCERPHALYHALAGPGGRYVDPHKHLTVRGVPAIRFDGGRAITLYTKWTTLTIRSDSPHLTRKAARAAMPAPDAFRADAASYAKLPRPSAAISSNRLTTVRCPE